MFVVLVVQLFGGVWSTEIASRVCRLFAVVDGNLTILSFTVDVVVKHLAYNSVTGLDLERVVLHVIAQIDGEQL